MESVVTGENTYSAHCICHDQEGGSQCIFNGSADFHFLRITNHKTYLLIYKEKLVGGQLSAHEGQN